MPSGDFVTLKQFSMPLCDKCKTPAIIVIRDNGACGDPDCCGDYLEYAVAICEKCNMEEAIA